MSKRLDYIDKAKGILIILVVIGHIWQSGPVFNDAFFDRIAVFWMARLIKNKGLLLAVSTVLFILSLVIKPGNNHYVGALEKVLYYVLFFACGFCCPELFKKTSIPLVIGSLAVVLVVGLLINKDSERMLSPKALVYLISGLCGTYAVIQAGKISYPHLIDRTLTQAGMNTIIIYGTHHFYYAVIGKLLGVTDYTTTPIITGLVILLGVAILEVPTIYIINRWLPWLAGKRKKRIKT